MFFPSSRSGFPRSSSAADLATSVAEPQSEIGSGANGVVAIDALGTDAVGAGDAAALSLTGAAETGTAVDVGVGGTLISASDTASAADAVSIIGSLPAETASGAESASITISAADTGSSADASTGIAVSSSEAGAGTEGQVVGQVTADAGVGVEASTGITVSPAEAATGVDVATSLALSTADTGSGADSASVTVTASPAETGSGADLSTALVLATPADSGSGVDLAAILVSASVSAADVGTGADVGSGILLVAADSASSLDSASAFITATGTDTGNGAESASVLIRASDVGSGIDEVAAELSVSASEIALGQDLATSNGLRQFTISLIIPARNEAVGLRAVLGEGIPDYITEVIVVDGQSTDGTPEVVLEICPRARIVHQSGTGKGDAIKLGLALATSDIVVTMDGDGSHRLSDIPPMLDKLLLGYDFVKGSRALPGAGSDDFTALRQAGNWALTSIAAWLYGADWTDITYGFHAYWRNIMIGTQDLSDGFQFEVQTAIQAARAGLAMAEVPCYERPRIAGVSNLHAGRDGWRILKVILGEASPRRRARFQTVAHLNLRQEGPKLVIAQADLLPAIEQTVVAASSDDGRPVLTGVLEQEQIA
jgi:Glycosyl transferase family 2